jgi:tRNA G18 (ribose-2'-O)-methylase SpoU
VRILLAHTVVLTAADYALRDYTDLTDVALRKVREPAEGIYIAESPKVIRRAIVAGHIPRSALVLAQKADEVVAALDGFDCPVYLGSPEVLEQIAGFHLHRGALASFERPALPPLSEVVRDARTVVICENIVDHTNVGAIFRAVAGMGADAVLITPRCADPFYRRSVRVSMGAVFSVPWTRSPDWQTTRDTLHEFGFHIAALALTERSVSLSEFAKERPERVALVLGTEGDGLTSEAISVADSVVRIPMRSGVDSLNVASASAVALYALCPEADPRMSR